MSDDSNNTASASGDKPKKTITRADWSADPRIMVKLMEGSVKEEKKVTDKKDEKDADQS